MGIDLAAHQDAWSVGGEKVMGLVAGDVREPG